MQGSKIQNINGYNLNFRAKFSIKGDIEEIPKKAFNKWVNISKTIGNDKDEILVNIAEEVSEHTSSGSSTWSSSKGIYSRSVAISTYLNNKLDVDIIQPYSNFTDIFYTGMRRPNPQTSEKARLGLVIDSISEYLLTLKNAK